MDFNLGEALRSYKENSEITVLGAGTYRLECTTAKAGVAKAGPTITPVFKVQAGPQAGSRVMTGKLSFAETALWRTIPLVKGFGITEEFMHQANSTPDPIQAIADAMVGRVIDATVKIDEWQGEERNKLDKVAVSDDAVAPTRSQGHPSPPPPADNEPSF